MLCRANCAHQGALILVWLFFASRLPLSGVPLELGSFALKCEHQAAAAALWFSSFSVFSLQKSCKKPLDGSVFYGRDKGTCQAARFTPVFNENTVIAVTAVGLQLVDTLPEEMRPGPDFHGLPWEPVIVTALVGIVTLAIFFWRTCLSVSILHACKPADVSLTDCSFVWLNCFSITGVKAICSLLCFLLFLFRALMGAKCWAE